MIKSIGKVALAAAAVAVLPGVAHAGTATAAGTATFNVVDQCSVAGATVNLGTYLTTNTWNDVANELGKWVTSYAGGTKGQEYLTWGSVNCNTGTPYTLNISGSSVHALTPGGIQMTQNAKAVRLSVFVKKIGTTVIPDLYAGSNAGQYMGGNRTAGATGTGAPQTVAGSVTFNANASDALLTDSLAVPGAVSDTLTYTLNF